MNINQIDLFSYKNKLNNYKVNILKFVCKQGDMGHYPGTAERFIDPTTDFGFKKIFGNVADKYLLINFLNGLLRGRKCIKDISYGPNEHADGIDDRKVIFDLFCTGSDGDQFIIEMQNLDMDHFVDRCLFYASRIINKQLGVGKKHKDYS